MVFKLPALDARIPKWNHVDLTDRACPICNSAQRETVYERPDRLKVCHCNHCSAFFVSPGPSKSQLEEFYRKYHETHRRESRTVPKDLVASYKAADPFADLRLRELASCMSFRDASVLDVGCGTGYFLYYLKKLGAIAHGVDLDPKAMEFAKLLGIENVVQTNLADYNAPQKFALITLLDLIEHPLNPMELLRRAVELLKPGGLLLIWTPNGDSVQRDKDVIAFRVDLEHMQYLTPEVIRFLSHELHLRILHLETLGFPNLKDIERPLSQALDHTSRLKNIIKCIPGYSVLNRLKYSLREIDERTGAYHLFAIMQRFY